MTGGRQSGRVGVHGLAGPGVLLPEADDWQSTKSKSLGFATFVGLALSLVFWRRNSSQGREEVAKGEL